MLQKKTIIIIAISISAVALLGILIWLFFPVLLRWVSPTMYTQYALNETRKVIDSELSEINDFFGFPDLQDSDVKHISAGINGVTANIKYGGFNSPDINLSKLEIDFDLLYDREAKQASLDLQTGWDGNSFLLTLFTNVEQIALGINNDTGWVVNAKTIGKELSEIGLPVDEDLTLDLDFLFPDKISDEAKEKALEIAADFFKALKFGRDRNSSHSTQFDGTTMTAFIDGSDFQDFIGEIIECYFEQSDTGNELHSRILQMNSGDYELAVFINDDHIVQAIRLSASADSGSDITITAQLPDTFKMLDHIIVDISIVNDNNRHVYSFESKGRHVPVDGVFSDITTIKGFDFGDILLSSEIREDGSLFLSIHTDSILFNTQGSMVITDETIGFDLNTLEIESLRHWSLNLSGDLTFSYGNAVSAVRDISVDALNITEFEIFKFLPAFLIVWEVLQQDHTLMDMLGEPIYDLALTFIFGDRLGSFINDNIDISGIGILDTLFDMFSGHLSDAFSSLLESLMLDTLSDMLEDFGDFLNETVGDRLNDIFSGFFDLFRGDD